MIRFVLAIKEREKLTTLLNLNESDYLTILVNNHGAYFMVESVELYTHKFFEHMERDGITNPFCFRISKKKLIGLLIEGTLEFKIIDNKVDIECINTQGEKEYNFITSYEEDTFEKYINKIELLDNLYDYPTIDISKISQIMRMSRSLGVALNCQDNVAFIRLPSIGVFTPFNSDSFAVNGKLLTYLEKFTTTVHNAQNYIGYTSEDMAILITKYRDTAINEFDFISKEKSSFKISFKLKHMMNLCKRLKFSDGTFILDLEQGEAVFEENNSCYKTKVEVTEVISAKIEKEKKKSEGEVLNLEDMFSDDTVNDNILSAVNYGIPKLIIPSAVLRNLLLNINSLKNIILYIKKSFIQMKIDDLNIVFARSDIKC